MALPPEGKIFPWGQSTAATTTKQTYIRGTSPDATASLVNVAVAGERIDADPAWSPDSKTLAFFSTAGEKGEQKQLWTVNPNGSGAQKLTNLNGYAAPPP